MPLDAIADPTRVYRTTPGPRIRLMFGAATSQFSLWIKHRPVQFSLYTQENYRHSIPVLAEIAAAH